MQARPGFSLIRVGKDILHRLEIWVMKNPSISGAWYAYRASAVAQAIARNWALLIALVALDLLLRLPAAGRVLFVIPVFGLTRVAGVKAGVGLATLATLAGMAIDRATGVGEAWFVNALLGFAGYATIAFKVEGMVDRLKVSDDAAAHDVLTGAYNRLGFVQSAETVIA